MDDASDRLDRQQEKLIIAQAKIGDRQALRKLVDSHKDRLFAFIWRMVRNTHDAEEICQDAFLKAFASLDSFSVKYRFSTWLFTIGYRVCLNRLRRKRPIGGVDIESLSIASSVPDILESADLAELKDQIWSAVDRLSPPQRATVILFYRLDKSCQDIARVLEVPVATVKSHLHRARNRLREMLEPVSDQQLHTARNLSGLAG